MDRNEAVLRELNLYPSWRLREGNCEAVGHPAASSLRGRSDLPAEERETTMAEEVAMPEGPVAMPEGAVAMKVAEPMPDVRAETALTETATPMPMPSGVATLDWSQLKAAVRDCNLCKLRAGCTQTVFGVGDENASWLFVGEGPGADEDALGEPFVGQAGKLLDNMLLALRLKRGNDVYIANVVKCRPPGNRVPEADEVAACLPYLRRQIQLIQPKVIVALGKTAASALLGTGDATLGSLRGKEHAFDGIPLVVTYHPAYLLRSPLEKSKAWEDLLRASRTVAG